MTEVRYALQASITPVKYALPVYHWEQKKTALSSSPVTKKLYENYWSYQKLQKLKRGLAGRRETQLGLPNISF
jgi:hypothetical protein